MKTLDIKTASEMIKEKLENEYGVKFGNHYGSSICINGDLCSQQIISRFFEKTNMGDYSVDIFRLPNEFYIKIIDIEEFNEFITN